MTKQMLSSTSHQGANQFASSLAYDGTEGGSLSHRAFLAFGGVATGALTEDSPGNVWDRAGHRFQGRKRRAKVNLGCYQLMVGVDIITAIDDQPATDIQILTVYLETETAYGDTTVELTVLRDGAPITIPVTFGEEPQV